MSQLNVLLSSSPIACCLAVVNRQANPTHFQTITRGCDDAAVDLLGYFKGRVKGIALHVNYSSANDKTISKSVAKTVPYVENTVIVPDDKIISHVTNTVFDIVLMVDNSYHTPRLGIDGLTETGCKLINEMLIDATK